MGEQTSRTRAAVRGSFEDPGQTHNLLSKAALRPLLDLRGKITFSKGFSKGFSKDDPATRSKATPGGELDGYLIGGTAGRSGAAHKASIENYLEHLRLLDVYLIGRSITR